MTLELNEFLKQLVSTPPLLITVLLVLGVVFVNGWTDAPNAIATVISTRAMNPRAAIIMAAFFDFLGVFVMTLINSTVAQTIYKMVTWRRSHDAWLHFVPRFLLSSFCDLCMVVWHSHQRKPALIAGITGAALPCRVGLQG